MVIRTQPGLSLTYGLVESLGQAIVTGEYAQVGFPTEAELSKQFGASRTVTREAVKMLTAKGLLSARPRHGTVVEPETEWNLLDPDVLRWMLERKFSLRLLAASFQGLDVRGLVDFLYCLIKGRPAVPFLELYNEREKEDKVFASNA